jgi:hypothetical protein
MYTVYLFQIILNINTYFTVRAYYISYVVEKRCVYCEVGNWFMDLISINVVQSSGGHEISKEC